MSADKKAGRGEIPVVIRALVVGAWVVIAGYYLFVLFSV
jgi:hypothetical protein